MLKIYTSLLLLLAAGLLLNGCQHDSDSARLAQAGSNRSDRVWLEPVPSVIGLTGRSVMSCPAGKCVVLHFPPVDLKEEDAVEILTDDPSVAASEVELYHDPSGRWCQDDPHAVTNTFNCCTYAVGDVVGLTTDDWISPEPTGATCYTVPMQVILDSYFWRVRAYQRPFEHVAVDPTLHADDVLCFASTGGPVLTFCHAGRICKKDGENWIISKFGSGPLVRTTIRAAVVEYDDYFDEIWVYRAK